MVRFSPAQNALYLTVASVFQKVVAFVYFTIVARMVGVEDVGKYVFALTFTTIFSVFVDAGLSPALNREVARDPARAEHYLHTVLTLKGILSVVVYAVTVLAVRWLGYETEIRHLVYLSGITMLFDSLHLTWYAVFRGFQNLRYEAYAMFGSQLLTLLFGSIALFLKLPLIFLILAFTIPAGLNALYAGILLKYKHHLHLFPRAYDKHTISFLLNIAWAFALAGIFSRLYSYFDTVLLSQLLGTAAVGIYSIPNKIAFAFQFIPLALSASIYPAMSRAFVESKETIARLFERSMVYLLLAALPIAGGLFALARPVIITLYGNEFEPSIVPLQILMVSMIFAFLSFPAGALLNACNRQKTQTAIMGVTVVLSVLINSILIPRMGVIGAAVAALCGNFFLMAAGLWFAPALAPISWYSLAKQGGLILCSALVMMGVVIVAQFNMSWLMTIPLGALMYAAMLFLLGVVHKEHWNMLLSLLKRSYPL